MAWTALASHAGGNSHKPFGVSDGVILFDSGLAWAVGGNSALYGAGAWAVSPEHKVKRTCARCGKEYEGALHGRYCGNSCKQKAYRNRKKYGNAQTSKQLRTCARCGVQFEGSLHGRYHSNACKQAAYRERKQRKVKL